MTVYDAIWLALLGRHDGETFSLAWLADEVSFWRGQTVLEATVERYLRWWTKKPDRKGRILRTETVRNGVRRIVEKHNPEIARQVAQTAWSIAVEATRGIAGGAR